MGANFHAMRLCKLNGGSHVVKVRSVKTTGDVCDMDFWHDAAIVAESPDPEAFSHVAVQQRHRPLQTMLHRTVAKASHIVKLEIRVQVIY
jgi:hypothetical protein